MTTYTLTEVQRQQLLDVSLAGVSKANMIATKILQSLTPHNEAAAPDLLEALTILSDWAESLISDNECRPLENARAAIAKATGETQ